MEKEASQEAARTDTDLKAALVGVAEKDRDRTAAAADFARLTAPFDGVIVKRAVDPGMFVQNATTGASEPLVTLARIDLVTVAMKFLLEAEEPEVHRIANRHAIPVTGREPLRRELLELARVA